MNVNKTNVLLLFLVLAGVSLTLWGCPKKIDVASSQETQIQAAAEAEAAKQAEEEAAGKQREEDAARERAAKDSEGLKPIYFDFDRADIRDDARSALTENAGWLRSHPSVNIRIEGNCDERGTAEYNQALGQRRAQSAKKYLTNLGISGSRVSLLSYGKERPACTESTEDCRQKNRRADFVVKE